MGQAGIDVEGLKDLRRELKKAGTDFPKALRAAGKDVSVLVAKGSRERASSMGGVQAKAASKIKAYATASGADVGFPSGGIAGAAFWGTLRHTGWYAAPRYRGSPRQHPIWVGSGWDVGGPGGPYAINETVARELPRILDLYADAVEALCSTAFPD